MDGNLVKSCKNKIPAASGVARYFSEELTRILAILTKSKSDVIIAGDFNIDMLKINENNHVSHFLNTVTSHTFFPKITLPTRFSDRNSTLIDNFLCKLIPIMIPCVINIPNLCNYKKKDLNVFTSKQMTSIR